MTDNPMRSKTGHFSGHVPHAHAQEVISDTEKLKRKVQKISAVLDFYEDLKGRKMINEKDIRDSMQKMEFARKQILKLSMEGKKIIKDAESKEKV